MDTAEVRWNVNEPNKLTLSCSGAHLQEEPLDQTGSSQTPRSRSDGNASEKRAGPAQSRCFAFADLVSEYKSESLTGAGKQNMFRCRTWVWPHLWLVLPCDQADLWRFGQHVCGQLRD